MSFIWLYVTHPDRACAEKIGNILLEKKLIACYNLFPIESAYWWNSEIAHSNEIVSLLKTRTDNWKAVKQAILEIHPYVTPCIIRLEMQANEEYEKWIEAETEI